MINQIPVVLPLAADVVPCFTHQSAPGSGRLSSGVRAMSKTDSSQI